MSISNHHKTVLIKQELQLFRINGQTGGRTDRKANKQDVPGSSRPFFQVEHIVLSRRTSEITYAKTIHNMLPE